MTTETLHIEVRELGQRAAELIAEMRESGADVMIESDGEAVAVLRNVDQPAETSTDEDSDDWKRRDAEAWAELVKVRERVSRSWTSPLTGAEAVEEQRR